jgi:Type II CAAX prenyl endopeptidase Rce1-like
MKLTLYVALLWAVWHMPDHFAVEGWGIQALNSAPVVFAIEVVSLFFARAIFVWFYNRTGSSVLLVAIFHASFDGSINQLSYIAGLRPCWSGAWRRADAAVQIRGWWRCRHGCDASRCEARSMSTCSPFTVNEAQGGLG